MNCTYYINKIIQLLLVKFFSSLILIFFATSTSADKLSINLRCSFEKVKVEESLWDSEYDEKYLDNYSKTKDEISSISKQLIIEDNLCSFNNETYNLISSNDTLTCTFLDDSTSRGSTRGHGEVRVSDYGAILVVDRYSGKLILKQILFQERHRKDYFQKINEHWEWEYSCSKSEKLF